MTDDHLAATVRFIRPDPFILAALRLRHRILTLRSARPIYQDGILHSRPSGMTDPSLGPLLRDVDTSLNQLSQVRV